MSTPSRNGIPAGDAADPEDEFGFRLPQGRRPSEERLWQAIYACFSEIRDGFGDRRQGSATVAEELFERLQAYHLLLCKSGYATVQFRIEASAAVELLRPTLQPQGFAFDLSEFRDKVRQRRVWTFARNEADRLNPTDLCSLPMRLTEADARSMEPDYTRIHSTEGDIFLESVFAEEMLQGWQTPLLTTTAHAVETTHMLDRLEREVNARIRRIMQSPPSAPGASLFPFPLDEEPSGPVSGSPSGLRPEVSAHVLAFVESCYVDGLFADRQYPGQDLYGTSSGIAVFKAARDLACNERCANVRELEALFPGKPRRYLEIRERVTARLGELLRPLAGTVVELNHATRILWNLTPGDRPGDLVTILAPYRAPMIDFLRGCMRSFRASPDGGAQLAAFSSAPHSQAVCLTACLGTLRLKEHAGLKDASLDAHVEAAIDYVRACQSCGSGFGSSIRHRADLLHTYMAVSFLSEKKWKHLLDVKLKAEVVDFVRSCQKSGGYAFLPEWKPSAYGTRLAFQIFQRLELPVPDRGGMREFIEALRAPFDGSEQEGFVGRPRNAEQLAV